MQQWGEGQGQHTIDELRALTRQQEHAEAIAHIADAIASERTPIAPALALINAEALVALERYGVAERVLGNIARDRATGEERAEILGLEARIALERYRDFERAVDLGRRAVNMGEQTGGARGAVLHGAASAALAFAIKRAAACAESELARAESHLGSTPELLALRATVLLEMDDRAGALALYERCAVTPGGARLAALGRARVARLVGDFDGALDELASIGAIGRGDLAPRSERARVLASARRWDDALAAQDDLLRASPWSDAARSRRADRAGILLELGRAEEALVVYEDLAGELVEDSIGRAARRNLRIMRKNAARTVSPRARLQGFGTLTQLRDHCGPACCELLLRFYGKPVDQVDVARQIKRPDAGTPIYAMRAYLEAAGLHVRRVEAELPLLKKVIDAGVPLILHEEYSTTTHVAIAIGYDDVNEVLEVQDPMTHALRRTPYEDLPRLLALANNGTIVAVPAGDAERAAALDAIGAVEAEYMRLTDEAQRALDDGDLEEAERKADASIALRKDYEYSWIAKFSIARRRADKDPTRRPEVLAVLKTILELWPDDEWPQQYTGYVAMDDERHLDAMRAFERARDRDDGDGRNWAMIGECLVSLGRWREAIGPFREALRRMPWHVRANENLADLLDNTGATGEARALNDAAIELHPTNAFNHEVSASIALDENAGERALAAANRAHELAPARRRTPALRARALLALGRGEEARAVLASARAEKHPDAAFGFTACRILLNGGQLEAAAEISGALLAKEAQDLDARALHSDVLTALGQMDEGHALLRGVLAEQPAHVVAHAVLGKYLAASDKPADAVTAFATATAISGDAEHRSWLAEALLSTGAREAAGRQATIALREAGLTGATASRAARVLCCVQGFGPVRAVRAESARSAEARGVRLAQRAAVDETAPASEVIVAPLEPSPSPAQRWVVAVGGILRHINKDRFDLLGGAPRPDGSAAGMLHRSWDITRREQLDESIAWLRREGHRREFAKRSGRSELHFFAWDFARISNLASWGYCAHLLDADAAWAILLDTALAVQLVYRSFRELGDAYSAARTLWNDKIPDTSTPAVEALLSPGEAWHDLAWDTPLEGTPVLRDPVLRIDASSITPLEVQIERAFAGVDPEKVAVEMTLESGMYQASLAHEGALTLIGAGPGVVIVAHGEDAPIASLTWQGGLFARDIELLVERADVKANGADVIKMKSGFARLERCTIRGGNFGLDVGGKAVVQLFDSTIDDCRASILVRTGHAHVESSTVRASRLLGLETNAEGSAYMFRSHVDKSFGSGVRVGGEVDLVECNFAANGFAGLMVVKGGRATLERCDMHDGGNVGVLIQKGAAKVFAVDCAFRDNVASNAYIESATEHAIFERCRFERGDQVSVYLTPGERAVFRRCEVRGSKLVGVFAGPPGAALSPETIPRLEGCEITGMTEGGAVWVKGGALLLRRTRVHDVFAAAIDVSEGGVLRAEACVVGPLETVGVLLRDGGSADLVDCTIEDTKGHQCVRVTAGSTLGMTKCRLARGKSGLVLVSASTARLIDCEIRECDEAGMIVAEKSNATMRDGTLHGLDEGLYVQSGSRGVFTSVHIHESGVVVIDGGRAAFIRCRAQGSPGAGVRVGLESAVILDACSIDAAYGGIEAGAGGRVLAIDTTVRQTPPQQAALFAHTFGRIEALGGTFRGGTEAAAEVRAVSHIVLRGAELIPGAVGRTEVHASGELTEHAASAPIATTEGPVGSWRARLACSLPDFAADAPTLATAIAKLRGGIDGVTIEATEGGIGVHGTERARVEGLARVLEVFLADRDWLDLARLLVPIVRESTVGTETESANTST